ncbi:type IV toxin-antitoxin system AbiEi family antitoxin domain-containing protein [Phytoactinopolyspora endophytica]|uniref:type IV toxin-antitoxin system AbiEi family antitoxin domain-containing protein n=1 Tax=Phytoactinopolyspora endophytica TaxID=1642495 RepID=UPI00101BD5F8|nr:type IV toxin-antitoxin system AbiEi family antitoxin domain-containing protein [Phytoactinopolyspora endophytica]
MVPDHLLYAARRQDGLITRKQALAAGMSLDAWKHATRKHGSWRRILRGVYATFTGPLRELHRLRAALLHAGADSAITGAWGCWMHGLKYGPEPGELILVSIPQQSRVGPAGFVAVTRRACSSDKNRSREPTRDSNREHHDYWVDQDAAGDLSVSIAMSYEAPDEIAGEARPGVIPVVPTAQAVIDTVTKPRWLPAGWSPTCAHADGCPMCSTALEPTVAGRAWHLSRRLLAGRQADHRGGLPLVPLVR